MKFSLLNFSFYDASNDDSAIFKKLMDIRLQIFGNLKISCYLTIIEEWNLFIRFSYLDTSNGCNLITLGLVDIKIFLFKNFRF